MDCLRFLKVDLANLMALIVFAFKVLAFAIFSDQFLDDEVVLDRGGVGKLDEFLVGVVNVESLEEMEVIKAKGYFGLFAQFASVVVVLFWENFAVQGFYEIVVGVLLVA